MKMTALEYSRQSSIESLSCKKKKKSKIVLFRVVLLTQVRAHMSLHPNPTCILYVFLYKDQYKATVSLQL